MQLLPITQSCATWAEAIRKLRLPIRVAPPATAGRWIVTCSRNVLLSPMTTLPALGTYLRCCGRSPMMAWLWKTLFSPTVIGPKRWTPGRTTQPAPRRTAPSMTANGPICTSAADLGLGVEDGGGVDAR